MQGKLIVFEGIDGSGKSTQFRLLCERLRGEGAAFHQIVFPRYSQPSSAMVKAYLGGEFGKNPSDVSAYAASTFYAVDRFASFRVDWGGLYRAGELILSDRYTTSNAVHQASKLPEAERQEFLGWLFDLEYHRLGLPKPDLVFYLDLPMELSEKMMRHREQETGATADIHERDNAYLRSCRESARQIAAQCGWRTIDCGAGGAPRAIADIHEEVYALTRELLTPVL